MLVQPLKRCSASRIKPNETFELAKKRQKHTLFWGVRVCERKNFFYVVTKLRAKSQKPVKNLLVLQFCS